MPYNSEHETEGIRLTNVIAFLGAAATFFILAVLVYFFGWPRESNRWYVTATIIIYLLIPLCNKAGYHLLSKYLISFTPVAFCFVVSIVNKKIGPIYINDYYVYRLVLLTASIVPILIFRYNQYLHLVICLLPVFLGLIFFDTIHRAFDVGIFQTGYTDDTYFMITFTSVACYIAVVGFIYILKKKNDIYFEDIFAKSFQLEKQNKKLATLNKKVETRNRTIERQNEQLKDFSSHLQKKVNIRTKELTSLNKELAEQNIKLEQFTFITAHNIKSPVAQIKGLLNLLNYESNIDLNVKEILGKIQLSCMNLEEVIGDLNKILNIKNGSHVVEVFDVSEIVNQIFSNLKTEISKNNIAVIRNYNFPAEIKSIRAFVYSVLYNLIQNAVKYSDVKKSEPFISVDIKEKKFHLEITVADNGKGFEQNAVKDKLFQLYQRFNTDVQGKGIGLFLVKTQLEMVKGDVVVSSEIGLGTTFIVKIPKTLSHEEEISVV